jgi:hemerythrin-like domain-containing protein
MKTAISILKEDDEELAAEVERLESMLEDIDHPLADGDALADATESFRRSFVIHAKTRRDVLYPALAAHRRARAIARQGEEELELARLLLDRLTEGPLDAEVVVARGRLLLELVERHLEREQDELLPRVRKLDDIEIERVGEALLAIRGDLAEAIDQQRHEVQR